MAIGRVCVAPGTHRHGLVQNLHVVLLFDDAALPGRDDDRRVGQGVSPEDGHLLPVDGLAAQTCPRRRSANLLAMLPGRLLRRTTIPGGGIGAVDVGQGGGYLVVVVAAAADALSAHLAFLMVIDAAITTTTTNLYPAAQWVNVLHAVVGGTGRRRHIATGGGIQRRHKGHSQIDIVCGVGCLVITAAIAVTAR